MRSLTSPKPSKVARPIVLATRGHIRDEDPLRVLADALAVFPADALILAVHALDVAN